ncbi:conserved hypothetical protein [Carnobacterium maltaromaticum]|uniref:AOC03_06830 family ribosome hibernation factor n=1 Tax=Carnobacterium maltaromaticum TaxID=2751 RepID=UPI00191B94F8|nr:hypothetical protein [Carnobacterium maltaromaticum]CAD5901697.1 conserved hypothetical protein [Carnobacterium maltaromaticum]
MDYSELKKISDFTHDPAVTISLRTHRTSPKNQKDAIVLKNLINETEERLLELYDKRKVWGVMDNLRALETELNHQKNLDTLILFASEDFKEAIKLPIEIEKDTVKIDKKFSTRNLIRAVKQTEHYYVLTLSQQEVRVLEFFNDTFVQEFETEDFPFKNTEFYETDPTQNSIGAVQNNLIKEFFNRADNAFYKIYRENPLPVILAGVQRNIEYYHEIANQDEWFIGSIHGSFDRTKITNHEIVELAYPVIEAYVSDQLDQSLADLETAENENKLVNELSNIYKAVTEGRGKKLYVEKDFFQSAVIEEGTLIVTEDTSQAEVVDDIVNEIIHTVTEFGGEVVFVPNDYLAKYHHIALILRY